jgi:hypothetical protein
MKALKITGIAVLAIVAVVVFSIAVMSPKSHLERSVVINGAPSSVYEEIASLKNFNTWSPWTEIDPDAKFTFEGPEIGIGSKMSWVSTDDKLGQGSQWIIEAEENRRIKTGLAFAGLEGNFTAEFILEPVNEGTKVTWTYDGDVSNTPVMNAAMGKMMGALMDSMMGGQYEQGLNSLKRRVENKPATQPQPQPQN